MNWNNVKSNYPNSYEQFVEWCILESEVDTYPISDTPFAIYSGLLMQFFDEQGIKILIRENYSFSLSVYTKRYDSIVNYGTIGDCLDAAYIDAFNILENSKKIEI